MIELLLASAILPATFLKAILLLVVIGVAWWLIGTITMDARIKVVINLLLVIFLIYTLLTMFGLL